jgi:hypothetical protein
MKLGRPEYFRSNTDIRILAIKRAISIYQKTAEQLKSKLPVQDEYTKLYLVGLGNDTNILACLKDLFFNSRELLDVLLVGLNRLTKGKAHQTSKDFVPFAQDLMRGNYDIHNLDIFQFLKVNITYIFNIRKLRNEIKNSPNSIEFRYNTNSLEAWFLAKIDKKEKELIEYLDINNKNEALQKMQFACTYNLDILFPETDEFWKECFYLMDKSKENYRKT